MSNPVIKLTNDSRAIFGAPKEVEVIMVMTFTYICEDKPIKGGLESTAIWVQFPYVSPVDGSPFTAYGRLHLWDSGEAVIQVQYERDVAPFAELAPGDPFTDVCGCRLVVNDLAALPVTFDEEYELCDILVHPDDVARNQVEAFVDELLDALGGGGGPSPIGDLPGS